MFSKSSEVFYFEKKSIISVVALKFYVSFWHSAEEIKEKKNGQKKMQRGIVDHLQGAKSQEMSTLLPSLLKSFSHKKQTGYTVPTPSFELSMTCFLLCKAELSHFYLI